jgi:tripartite-type tricarboxylate transporter receptor subunit TctC
MKVTFRHCLIALAGIIATITNAVGQDYPNRPVKIIVGYPPGGAPDLIGRLLGDKLTQALGQPFIVENRPGAGATLATAAVAKSPGDGYTLLIGETGQLEIAPFIQKALPYNTIKELTPIGLVATTPLIFVTSSKTGTKTIQELILKAKANPDKLNYGSSGIGSIHHISMEVFKADAGVNFTHIAYKGSPQVLPALLSGEVDLMLTSFTVISPHARAGTVNMLAVSSAARFDAIPDVPPMSDVIPGYDYASEIGVLGPANMPPAVVSKLSRAIKTILDSPEIQNKFKDLGLILTWTTPDGYADKIRYNLKKYERAVRLANIKPD